MAKSLTSKQEAFSVAIAKGRTGADAYRDAYRVKWTDDAIYVAASRLLKNTKVALRVKELQAPMMKRHEVSVDKTLNGIAEKAYAQLDIETLTHGEQLKALEMLAKIQKIYEEAAAKTINNNLAIINVRDLSPEARDVLKAQMLRLVKPKSETE